MGLNSWIARVVHLARSVRADHWLERPWRHRRELRPDALSVRRLEPRRVLSASIQTLAVPATATEGDTVEVSAEATGVGLLSFDWTVTRDSAVIARAYTQDFSFETPDNGAYDVSLVVTDSADQGADSANARVEVENAAPEVSILGIEGVVDRDEDGAVNLIGVFQDPGVQDTHLLRINWGDPSSPNNEQTIDLASEHPDLLLSSGGFFLVSHQYLDDNPSGTTSDEYTISVQVVDDDGGVGERSTVVQIKNVAPTISELTAIDVNENGVTTLSGRIADPGTLDTHSLDIDWGDPLSPDNIQTVDLTALPPGATYDSETGEFTVEHQYLDDNPSGTASDDYTITVRVTDDDAGSSDAETTVRVTNVAPTLSRLAIEGMSDWDENSTVRLIGVFNDPGRLDTHLLRINWGDPSSPNNEQIIDLAAGHPDLVLSAGGFFLVSHQYLDDNPSGATPAEYSISVEVVDDDGGVGERSTVVYIKNVAPAITELSAMDVNENGVTTLTGRIVDPGSLDTHSLDINWGDPLSPNNIQTVDLTALPPGATYDSETGEFSMEHQYLDDNPSGTASDDYTIAVRVTDDDSGFSDTETTVRVTNVAPTLSRLAIEDTPDWDENSTVRLIGVFNDPGRLDTHRLRINWGDPSSPNNEQIIDLAAGHPDLVLSAGGFFLVTHQYLDDNPSGTTSDEYTISVDVVDDDGGVGERSTIVHILNVAPLLSEVDADNVDEHGFTTLRGKVADVGTLDTFTLTVNWADGSVEDYTTTPGDSGIDLLDPPEGVTFDAETGEFAIQHQYLDDNPTGTPSDPYEIRLTLVDDDADMAVDATAITVANVAPALENLSATSIFENDSTLLTGRIVDIGAEDTHTLEINWGDPLSPVNEQIIDLTVDTPGVSYNPATREFEITHQYLDDNPTGSSPAIYTISVKVIDDDTGYGEADTTARVTNVAPVIGEPEDVTIDEGDEARVFDAIFEDPPGHGLVGGSFTDVGALDTHTAQINWGDGHPTEDLTVVQYAGSGGLVGSHTYADNGRYTATITVTDDDGGVDVETFTVTVLNVDPVLTGTHGHEVFEGAPVTLAGLGVGVSDPGFDNPLNTLDPSNGGEVEETFTGVVIDWGDGSPTDVVSVIDRVSGSHGVPTIAGFSHDVHYYADDGTYTVGVTLRDDDGDNVTRTFDILVKNVDPTLVLTDEMFVINEGDVLFLPELGAFTDPASENPLNPNGPSDETFHYTIDWGDGLQDELQLPVSVVDGGPGVGKSGRIANQHFYADNDLDGVRDNKYTITVTLHDDDGGMDQQQFEITVNNVDPTIQPLTPDELIDDPWMPGILADAKDLSGDGVTVMAIRFDDPGADTFEVWVDWGDKLGLSEGDPRFVHATQINSVTTDKGVTLLFSYPYEGPPDPSNPVAPIEITTIVVDDDYSAATGGELVFTTEAVFLHEWGRSEPATAIITNPGIEQSTAAIDTTPEIALIDFPQLDEFIEPPALQAGGDAGQQTQDAPSTGGDQVAATERVWELRAVTPDGKVSQPFRLKPDVMDDLPALFARLPDGRYLIFLVRTENNSRRLALDIYLRNGKPIDISDDSDGARDKPPTTDDGDLDPAAEQVVVPLEAFDSLTPGVDQGAGPVKRLPDLGVDPAAESSSQQRHGSLLATAGVAAAMTRLKSHRVYRDEVEEALETSNGHTRDLLSALRRRPR